MSFTVTTPTAPFTHTALASERSPARHGGELEFDAVVAPGITVTWDAATPRQCVAFSVEPDADVVPATPAHPSAVAEHAPWLRLAAVTMLDSRLHLPLDRSLLDAEIAAAQVGAARTLSPAEPVRDYLVDRALERARHAARGVAQYLDRITAAGRRPPPPLAAALDVLARCYLALGADVNDLDETLASVTRAVDRLSVVGSALLCGGRRVSVPTRRRPEWRRSTRGWCRPGCCAWVRPPTPPRSTSR